MTNESIPILVSDDEFAKTAESQRNWLRELANKVERGEPITRPFDMAAIAGVLRAFADRIPSMPKRKPGKRPQFCAGSVAIEYWARLEDGEKHSALIAELAEREDVSIEAIFAATRKHKRAAKRLLGSIGP